MGKRVWDEKHKQEIINMFWKYFELDELKDIVKSIEKGDPEFKEMMKEALKRELKQNQCLNCEKPVAFRSDDAVLVSGKISDITDKNSLSPFCNKTCLKEWIDKNI